MGGNGIVIQEKNGQVAILAEANGNKFKVQVGIKKFKATDLPEAGDIVSFDYGHGTTQNNYVLTNLVIIEKGKYAGIIEELNDTFDSYDQRRFILFNKMRLLEWTINNPGNGSISTRLAKAGMNIVGKVVWYTHADKVSEIFLIVATT